MTGWLQLTPEQRKASITRVEYNTGIIAKAIEKDWWVTLALRALFQSAYAEHIVFKGGTSLSKCWKLISRFSEDIDIALSPEAFGIAYQRNPTKSYVDKLKRAGCAFTSVDLKNELDKQLTALGVPMGLATVAASPIPENRPDTDPQTIHLKYPSLYDHNPYIADEVKIEVSVRSLSIPCSKVAIVSLLSEETLDEAYAEIPLEINTVEPQKTFLEKAFLLHEEFGKPDAGKIRTERMSRHLYDLESMMDTDTETRALADHVLYDQLIEHRQFYQRIPWVNYETLGHKTITFIPPSEVEELYKKDYQTMREQMIYGETKPFDHLIERLRNLQQKFRMKLN
ncbi:nucleotidyl transferase AbiEii/AbiGii toxin family protein [Fulvivirgaceae bacterium PWU4]|uniref:Nucleotidyl transferase AbiEii/AbiGii toxin family protein n=1 Tax=Chryseosolibacter histidini TaxID=2782349 RepID=A0AAP2DJ25_9BACT|nr:nucleotidyl transferase AbiEii/AbiGii toxin family protein [Chryseosolibacter histidini]MBT1695907.1 nucleotidyl transferase AbiEii/AbiGii toxin family protein [Chryseosolibacter histidini]